MLNKVQGILLILTFVSNTRTLEKPMKYNLKTKPNLDLNLNKNVNLNKRLETHNSLPKKWKFEDYLKKFEPSTIWEQIDKQKKYNGLIISDEEQTEMMFQGMDPIDEIMELKIENGDAKMFLDKGGRRGWKAPSRGYGFYKDKFFIRRRMYELMKQAIYQTRNKMVVMQIYREKYSNSSLYKMGFLFNKADNYVRTFGKFSFRAFRGCLLSREKVLYRMTLFDLLSANERQLTLWFSVELLADLIKKNHDICVDIFKNHTVGRLAKFDEQMID